MKYWFVTLSQLKREKLNNFRIDHVRMSCAMWTKYIITSITESHARIKTKVWIDSEVVDGGTTSLSLGCNTNLTYNDDAGKVYILWELCNYLTNDRYRDKKNIYVEYDPILYAHQMTMHRIYDQHRAHVNDHNTYITL